MKGALVRCLALSAIAATLVALVARPTCAMPADPRGRVVVQPDGRPITVFLRGDEWVHWYEDERGFTVTLEGVEWRYARRDADGHFRPTSLRVGIDNPIAAGLRAGDHPRLDARTESQRLSQGAATPDRATVNPTGTVKNLVVLCLFSNHTVAANGRAQAAFDSLFNQANSTGFNAPTGSVRDFYQQGSYNQFTLQSTVTTWVTLPQSESYYANGKNGLPFGTTPSAYPTNAAGMVQAALAAVDATVNFGDFDQDNDGFIDAVTFVHSGYAGEQSGNGLNTIWSHKYNLSSTNGGGVWTSADNNANGVKVKVDLYHTEAARWGLVGNDSLLRVGVVAHELGHFFGLPDLYDTDNSSAGLGNWCLMANSWGWDQSQFRPPLPSAWCRTRLGWVTPFTATNGVYSLRQVESFPDIAKVDVGYGAGTFEYLLIENRQPVGFDQQIPQGGLAVWHIDESLTGNTAEGFPGQSGWPGNGNHYKVALLQADGLYQLEHNTNKGNAGDLYRSNPGIALSEATTPSTDRYWNGNFYPNGTEISEVSSTASTMAFRLRPAVWVDFAYSGSQTGVFPFPYSTLAGGLANTADNTVIICKGGTTSQLPTPGRPMVYKTYGGTTTFGP